ncbi:MAG: RNA pseudouridine synthase [Bacilli bacterium]|jgi:23S rRNA pseudouridine1911/1915/1917 synthase
MNDKAPFEVIYEDMDIIAVYKKRNVFSVATEDKKTYTHNLFYYLRSDLKKNHQEVYLVHRLDYETSGVMVFAKNVKTQSLLKKSFEDRTVIREYEAVIKEKLPLHEKHHVVLYLDEEGMTVKVTDNDHGKDAITDIESINYINIGTALKINIMTGRRNQIRLALQSLNYSLLGDKRYSNCEAKRMYLNCYHLSFPKELGLKQNDFAFIPLWIKL